MKPIIHSVKHYVQFGINSITGGTLESIVLCNSVESTVANAADEIEEGAIVKAVYVELWLNKDTVDGQSIVTVCKDTKVGTGPTFTEQAALFTYPNKKNILFTHQGLTSLETVGNPINILRGWIKIPKSKQRFGLGDTLMLSISNVGTGNLFRCGLAIFKEYS